MDTIIPFLQSPKGSTILTLVGTLAIIFVVLALTKRLIPKYIESTPARYRARKVINFLGFALVVLAIFVVYGSQFTGLAVFLGVAGAGIAFALQEVIASAAGNLAIRLSDFYKEGDRVLLGGIVGDVIDIGILRTSLMETGGWVNGDLYNGRIVRVANSFVFKEPVYNYSGDFPFLWDEIKVPIKTNGDYEWATTQFLNILKEVQGPFAAQANKRWEKMTEKFLVEDARVDPLVHLVFDENWITFTLRYVVDYKGRRKAKDEISRRVLSIINASNGRIAVASAAFEITAFPGGKN